MSDSNTQQIIQKHIEESAANFSAMAGDQELLSRIANVAMLCTNALRQGKKVLFAGNGGSAADAQHLAGELVSRFNYDRPGLTAFALTTDTSILTAVGNDYGFERLFARQIEAVGHEGDVFIAISTSGNSANILAAIEVAWSKGLHVVGMTGESGGAMVDKCELLLRTPSNATPRIQEGHILMGHMVCQIIEQQLFPKA